MALARDVIIPWPGSSASIPANFVRETRLDGLFAKGTANGVDPNISGGSATHSHTSPAHTHTLADHVHSVSLSTSGTYAGNTTNTTDAQIMTGSHSHSGNTSATIGGNVTDALSYGSVSNNPPYYNVIFIRSLGNQPVPNGGIVFAPDATSHGGFTFCDGSSGTPDLRNKYLQGAATSADAGGTGGSLTNVHDISHTHTPTLHYHTGNSDTQNFNNRKDRNINHSLTQTALWPHSHSFTLTGATQALNPTSQSLTTAETVEPSYKKLVPLKNTSGVPQVFLNMIALWLNSLALIPAGWKHCNGQNSTLDMTNCHLKCANTTSEAGNTGGSNSHTHAAQTHSLTANGGHSHGDGGVSPHLANDLIVGGGVSPADPNQNHSITSVSTVTPAYADAATTADLASNEPQFLTVAFIQYQSEPSGGALLALL